MVFHSTVLFVNDIEVSKDFYIRVLGFTVIHDMGKNVILNNSLSLWEISPEHIISKRLKTRNRSNRFELYFEAANIDRVFETLNGAGITFLHTIHEEPWGQRTIRFHDPDNHLVEVGEPMDVFVNNLSKNGLTPVHISEKSGIPLAKVIGLIWK